MTENRSESSILNEGYYLADSSERAPAALRTILSTHFHTNRRAWNIVTLCRQRIALSAQETAITDICVLASDAPVERVVRTPPMICIDIISEEPLGLVQTRANMYERIGVKNIWLLDAGYRTGWRATSSGLFQIREDEIVISGTSIGFRMSAIFNELDELLQPAKRMSVSAAIEQSRNRR